MINVMNTRIDQPDPAEPFDDALRWVIPSRTNPHESYVFELNDAPGYDVCQCMHFVGKLGPLLARGITPEQAVAENLVKLKKGDRVEDALKCWHIREANYRYCVGCKRAMCVARRAQHNSRIKTTNAPTQNTPPPRRDATPDLGPSPGF